MMDTFDQKYATLRAVWVEQESLNNYYYMAKNIRQRYMTKEEYPKLMEPLNDKEDGARFDLMTYIAGQSKWWRYRNRKRIQAFRDRK